MRPRTDPGNLHVSTGCVGGESGNAISRPGTRGASAAAGDCRPRPGQSPKLSATQIVDKNVAARGGLTAWRAIQSMSITGKLDAGGKKDTLLPYTLQVKRPKKQRLTIDFAGHTALQVFDGEHGWKLRPYLNRPDPEPFSAEDCAKPLRNRLSTAR